MQGWQAAVLKHMFQNLKSGAMLRAAPRWIFPMHLDLSCKFLQTHLTFSIFRLSPWQALKVSLLWEAGLDRIPHEREKKSIHLPNSTKLVHWPPWAASQSSRQTLLSFGLQTWDPLVAQDPHSHWPCMKLTMKSFFLKHLTYALVLEFQLAHWVRWPPGLLLNRSCLAISDSKWALWENYGNAKLQNDSNSNRP